MELMAKEKKDPRTVYELPFPDELSGVIIEGIDVHILAADSLRIADYFAKHNELTATQLAVLKQNSEELKVILPHLKAEVRGYFEKVGELVNDLLRNTI